MFVFECLVLVALPSSVIAEPLAKRGASTGAPCTVKVFF